MFDEEGDAGDGMAVSHGGDAARPAGAFGGAAAVEAALRAGAFGGPTEKGLRAKAGNPFFLLRVLWVADG